MLECKLNKQLETFSFNPPVSLTEEGKWVLAVTPFEATKSVFVLIDEDNSFSITRTDRSIPEGSEETVDILNEILGLRSQNDFDLHAKVEKRSHWKKKKRKK